MAAYEPLKANGIKNFKSGSKSKRPYDDSNTAPGLKKRTGSGKKLNAKGASNKMTKTKQGSGHNLTKKLIPSAMKSMYQPDLN